MAECGQMDGWKDGVSVIARGREREATDGWREGLTI